MAAQPELDALARKERLRLVRDWSFGLGLMACVSALVAIGGGGIGNMGGAEALAESVHGRPYSLRLTLPPLGALFLKKS